MVLLRQAPALDPTIQVPQQDLPLQTLQSLADKYGDTMARAFKHIEDRRFAAQNTCTITRPLTPEDLIDPEVVKGEPELRHDRRMVDACGEVVSLEKGYFSGHPEPINLEPGRHRGTPKETPIKTFPDHRKQTWKRRRQKLRKLLENGLKKVGLAYDE